MENIISKLIANVKELIRAKWEKLKMVINIAPTDWFIISIIEITVCLNAIVSSLSDFSTI